MKGHETTIFRWFSYGFGCLEVASNTHGDRHENTKPRPWRTESAAASLVVHPQWATALAETCELVWFKTDKHMHRI